MSDRLLFHLGQGDETVTYDFDPGKLLNVEAIEIERQTGLALGPLLAGLADKSVLSISAIVWILRRRNGEPFLRFEDVSFVLDDCQITDPDVSESEAPKAEGPAKRSPGLKSSGR